MNMYAQRFGAKATLWTDHIRHTNGNLGLGQLPERKNHERGHSFARWYNIVYADGSAVSENSGPYAFTSTVPGFDAFYAEGAVYFMIPPRVLWWWPAGTPWDPQMVLRWNKPTTPDTSQAEAANIVYSTGWYGGVFP